MLFPKKEINLPTQFSYSFAHATDFLFFLALYKVFKYETFEGGTNCHPWKIFIMTEDASIEELPNVSIRSV